MEVTTIVILTLNKFTTRDYERFGIENFQQNGIDVKVFDLSGMYRSIHYTQTYLPEEEIKGAYIFRLKSIEDFKLKVGEFNPESILVSFWFNLYPQTSNLFRVLTELNIKYITQKLSVIPRISSDFRYFISKIIYKFRSIFIFSSIRSSYIHLVAGKSAIYEIGAKISKQTKIINVGSLDYNKFVNYKLLEKNQTEIFPDIILIDEFYPQHPDLEGEKILGEPEDYYLAVNKFLREISTKHNMSCGIVAHPRAAYKSNPFEFPLLINKSVEAISNAQYVVGHASTAFSFAVLAFKPIYQIGFKAHKETIYGKCLINYSKELGLDIIYLDTKYEITKPIINARLYQKYISNYLISDQNIKKTDYSSALISHIKQGK
jgi:hypothetical protein